MFKRLTGLIVVIVFYMSCSGKTIVDEVDMILTVKFAPDFNPEVIDYLLIEFKPAEPVELEPLEGSTADGGISYRTSQDQGVDVYIVTLYNSWIRENIIPVNPHQYELDLPFQVPFSEGKFQLKASAFKDEVEIGYGTGYFEYPPDNIYKRIEQPLLIKCNEEHISICNNMEE